jgi:hypothetical protein
MMETETVETEVAEAEAEAETPKGGQNKMNAHGE